MKTFEDFNKETSPVNENYGDELDNIQKAFDQAVKNMRGTSVISNGPIDVWIDFGVRNGFCDDNGNIIQNIDR